MLHIQTLEALVHKVLHRDGSGHDWYHVDRVRNNAMRIAQAEAKHHPELRLDVIEGAALLHDIADHKFHDGDLRIGPARAQEAALECNASAEDAQAIAQIVSEVSFKGAGVETPVSTPESAIVQDADRLDALGAVGIARCFAYGGSRDRLLWDPEEDPEMHEDFQKYSSSTGSSLNHFYEKLFLLKDRMNTDTGKSLAAERHQFMEEFVSRFTQEWTGKSL